MLSPSRHHSHVNWLALQITWTNIYLDDEVGITYDCGRAGVTEEYCIHFVSRTRTMDPDVLQQLVEYAESLGLNPRGIELDFVDHEGCSPPAIL